MTVRYIGSTPSIFAKEPVGTKWDGDGGSFVLVWSGPRLAVGVGGLTRCDPV